MIKITNLKMRIRRTSQGITLIALVITIIVLLILAGVSIATLTGEEGILGKAMTAKNETNQANVREQAQLAVMGSYDEDGNLNVGELKEELAKIEKIGTITDTNGKLPITVVIDSYEVTIDEKGKVTIGEEVEGTITPPSTAETSPFVPEGAKKIEGTIDTGLVMTDKNENEWVWIEVPRTVEVYQTAGVGIKDFTEEEYTKIEIDLQTYASAYRQSGYTDTFYATVQHGFADEKAYNDHKKSMLKSVYQNGGFYIGRYEVGTITPRYTKDDELVTAVIRQDAYPYNFITCEQAQAKSEELRTGGKTSSLMFGIQWDLVLKYIEEKGSELGETKEARQTKLKTDSSDWGNYNNIEFMITRGKYTTEPTRVGSWIEVTSSYTKPSSSVLLTTGATERNSVLGVYDLAGNVWEWTLEYTGNTSNPCAYRGGHCFNRGSYFLVFSRYYGETSLSDRSLGCRVALW